MRKLLLFTLFLIGTTSNMLFGQMYSFGGNGLDEAADMIVCSNQDILMVGTTSSDEENAANVYVLRTDTNFQCIWSLSLGGSGIEKGITVIENANQELLVIGNTSSTNNNGYGIIIWLIDANGEILWNTTYGSVDWDFATHAVLDSDGTYWITGSTFSFGNGASDALLLHILPDGSVINQWTYGTELFDEFVDLDFLNDGTMLLTGNQRSDDTTCLGWLATIDANGILSNFDFFGNDTLSSYIRQTIVHDNYIVHCGHTYQNGIESNYLRRLFQNGDVDWERLEFPNQSELYFDVVLRNNDYYIASASKNVGAGGYDALIYRLSIDGWFQDGMFYGTTHDDMFVSLLAHPNGWLYAAGSYTADDDASILIAYKQEENILSSENIGAQNLVGCFSVAIAETTDTEQVSETFYFDWIGKKHDVHHLPCSYIKKEIMVNGRVRTSKFCSCFTPDY